MVYYLALPLEGVLANVTSSANGNDFEPAPTFETSHGA
jgi:hypothetical protein